ncbi:hypothetical protein D3C77_353910 [compost metagenome]
MSLVNKLLEIVNIAEMLIHHLEIFSPVAMVAKLRPVLAMTNIKIDIVYNRRNPNRVNPQLIQIIKLLDNSPDIAAMVCFRLSRIIASRDLVWIIIARITIIETVCQQEIDPCLIPVEIQRRVPRSRLYCNFDRTVMLIAVLINDRQSDCFNTRCNVVRNGNCPFQQLRVNNFFSIAPKLP